MSRRLHPVWTTGFLATVLLGGLASAQEAEKKAPAPATLSAPVAAEIKILCDGKAGNNGEINLIFQQAGGEATTVRVTVLKGTGKQGLCKDIAKELAIAVGSTYKVDHYDDDKVKVEGKNKQKFSLALGTNTVSGSSISLKVAAE